MSRLRGLSLFANVGIAEAYMKQIGVEIKIANEIDEERARFYKDVYKETNMICGDITDDTLTKKFIPKKTTCTGCLTGCLERCYINLNLSFSFHI